MKKEFVIIYCKYVYIKSTFNVINIVLFVSEKKEKKSSLVHSFIAIFVFSMALVGSGSSSFYG